MTAYQAGQLVGVLLVILLFLGGFAFFVFAVVKAVKTGRKGWIVTASVAGLPALAIAGLFLYGVFVGIAQVSSRSHAMRAARQGDAPSLLTADMTPVQGRSEVPYVVSLPWEGAWGRKTNNPPYDYVFTYRELYIGIIVEGFGAGSPKTVCDFAQKLMQTKATQCKFTEPAGLKIGDLDWLSYDVEATVSNMDFKYHYFVYADKGKTAQIICWTGPAVFERYAPVMNRIAGTFRFTELK